MDTGVALTIDTKRLERALEQCPKQLFKNLRTSVVKSTSQFQRRLRAERLPKVRSSRKQSSSGKLQRRSGNLYKSLKSKVYGKDIEHLDGRVFFAWPMGAHAHLHEYGANPKPKKGKYLKIPMPDALTSRGKIKQSALKAKNTFVFRSDSGNLFIAKERGKDSVILLFHLAKSAKIPARLGMHALFDRMRPAMIDQAEASVDKALAVAVKHG